MDLDNNKTHAKNTSKSPIPPQVKIPNPLKSSITQDKHFPETDLSNSLYKLSKQWDLNLIDTTLKEQYSMLISSLSQTSAVNFIRKELSDLTEKNSYLQTCMKSINAREDSLKVILEMNDFLSVSPSWYKVNEIPLQCAEILHAHRFMTLTVAENIEKWKASLLCEYTEIDYVFYYRGENYLQKIKKDSFFCVYGELAKIFNFSKESDPFLVYPAGNMKNSEIKVLGNNYFVKDGMVSLPIPFGLLQKIAEMDKFINTGQIRQKPQMYFNENNASLLVVKKKVKRAHNLRYESKKKPKVRTEFYESNSPRSSSRIDYKKNICRKEIRKLESNNNKVKKKIGLDDEMHNDYKEKKRKTPKSVDRDQKKIARKSFLPALNQSFERKPSHTRITNKSTPISLIIGQKTYGKQIKNDDSQRKIGHVSVKSTDESVRFTIKCKKSFSAQRGFNKKSEDEAFSKKNTEKNISKSKKFGIKVRSLIKKHEKNEKTHENEPEKLYKDEDQAENVPQIVDFEYSSPDLNNVEDEKIENEIALYENHTIIIEDKNHFANPIAIKAKKKQKSEAFQYEESYADRKSSINSKNLFLHIAIEGITRNLIEEIILENNFQLIAEEEINEYLNIKESIKTRKGSESIQRMMQVLERNKIADLIYNNIIEEFSNQNWLEVLVSHIFSLHSSTIKRLYTAASSDLINPTTPYEDIEDYTNEIFTPGVHSPNEVFSRLSSISESVDKSSIVSEKSLKPQHPNPLNDTDFYLEPLNCYRKTLNSIIQDYYSQLQTTTLENCLQPEDIETLAQNSENSSFLWIKDQNITQGLFIFSTDLTKENIYNANVHHLSSININNLGNIIQQALKFLKSSNYIYANFQFPTSLKEDYYKIFQSITTLTQSSEIVMGIHMKILTGNLNTAFIQTCPYRFMFKGKLEIEIGDISLMGKKNYSEKMLEFGCRPLLLYHIYKIIQALDADEVIDSFFPDERLQKDMISLLEIFQTGENMQFPYVKEEINEKNDQKTESCIEIGINWPGCSFISYAVKEKKYKFMRFFKANVSKSEHFSVYYVPTTDPLLKTVFITYSNMIQELKSELKNFKTDLFHKVENLLKGVSSPMPIEELLLPCFDKKCYWDMGWMHNFVVKDNDESQCWVSKCWETAEISVNPPQEAFGGLKGEKMRLISDDFILVLVHSELEALLEIPICVALVSANDWKIV